VLFKPSANKIALALGCLALISGCSGSKRHVESEAVSEKVEASAAAESGQATETKVESVAGAANSPEWEAIQDALRRRHYRLDRVDEVAGVITTMPEASQHWFEFWRKDVATFKDFCEASLDPLRRWIEITVNKDDQGKYRTFSVVVHKERLSAPDRQFNNSTAVYQFFAESLPSTTGAARVTIQDNRWIDQGRDPAMENYLARKLAARTGLSVAPSHPEG